METNTVSVPVVKTDEQIKTETIRSHNDLIRRRMNNPFECWEVQIPCTYTFTRGVKDADIELSEIIESVRNYDSFDQKNDPHEEHDMAIFTIKNQELMWKIDYYDFKLEYSSEDPSDPAQTHRVLTILLTSER